LQGFVDKKAATSASSILQKNVRMLNNPLDRHVYVNQELGLVLTEKRQP